MAKTKITADHREAAQATVRALAQAGIPATVDEVLLAGAISNAVETIVTLASTGTDKLAARPELDTPLARKFYDMSGGSLDAAAVTVRSVAIARGVIRVRRTGASLEKQANAIAQALVECFAAMDIEGVAAGPDIAMERHD